MSELEQTEGDDTVAIELWNTADAMEWARAFNALYPEPGIDTMLGWFANAIEKGRAVGEAQAREQGRAEYAPHPGDNHAFQTICTKCGEPGMLHLSVITPGERVIVS